MVMGTTTEFGFAAPVAGTPASDYDTEFAAAQEAADAAIKSAIDGKADAAHVHNPLAFNGNQVKLVYRNANARWEFPDGTVPTLTGRVASITWEGTAAQIPAQGVGDADFKVGDTAHVRSETL